MNKKMVMYILFYTVDAFPFIALFEISLNHFSMSHPRRKRGKAKDTRLRRRLCKKGRLQKDFHCAAIVVCL